MARLPFSPVSIEPSQLGWYDLKSFYILPHFTYIFLGFYVLDPTTPKQLILGPFHGKVACQTISFSRGVCGAAARLAATQLIDDVEKFPGHIACDSDSRSEIVVPIFITGKEEGHGRVVAIIDVDCVLTSGFDEIDKKWLKKLGELVGRACDWPKVDWSVDEKGQS